MCQVDESLDWASAIRNHTIRKVNKIWRTLRHRFQLQKDVRPMKILLSGKDREHKSGPICHWGAVLELQKHTRFILFIFFPTWCSFIPWDAVAFGNISFKQHGHGAVFEHPIGTQLEVKNRSSQSLPWSASSRCPGESMKPIADREDPAGAVCPLPLAPSVWQRCNHYLELL